MADIPTASACTLSRTKDRSMAAPTLAPPVLDASPATPTPSAFTPSDWLLMASVAVIWGSSFLFISVGLDEGLAPGMITWGRILLGALALVAVPRARRSVDRTDRIRMWALGVLWVGVPFTLFPLAQQHVDSAVAGMINGAVPLSTALFAALITRVAPRGKLAFGLALGFIGVVAIAIPRVQEGSGSALGIGMLLAAIAMYGLSLNLAVPLQQRWGSEATMLNALAASVVVTAPFGLASLSQTTFTPAGVASLLPLGLLGTGLALTLFTTLVSRVGPSRGSIAIYFTPVVATLLGVLVLGDQIGPPALVGTAFVIAGAAVTSRSR